MRSEVVANRVDAFRRAPKAIYHRRKRGAETNNNDKKLSNAGGGGNNESDTSRLGSVVNLRSTLELFGSASFKLETYLERRVGHNKTEQDHKHELTNRKALLSGALKTFVTDHYQMFIQTSQEIENIETDLSNLHTLLNQYKISLKQLQDIDTCHNLDSGVEERSATTGSLSKKQTPYTGFITELIDELSMLLYERKLDQATDLVEAAYKRLDDETAGDVASSRELLNLERDKVINLSIEMFQNQTLKPNERRCFLNYVIRLGHRDKALNLFFEQRSALLRTGQSQIRSTGDLTSFITDMSGIVFSSIGHGWVEFKRIFREPYSDSRFLTWALNELNAYCNTVRSQVFQTETPFRTASQCVHLAILACKMLEKQGIKLSHILDNFFIDDLRSALRLYLSNARQTVTKAVRAENWVTESAWIKQTNNLESAEKGMDKLDITKSVRVLYDIIHQYIIDMKLVVLNPGLFDPTVNDLLPIAINGVRTIFEEYLLHMASASKESNLTEMQGVAIVGNARCLAEDLYPRLVKQLGPRLQKQRGLDDVLEFQEQLKKFYKAQKDYFSHKRADPVFKANQGPISRPP